MSLVNILMAVAAVIVTAWLGGRASSRAQAALWVAALLVSAAMFLPMSVLSTLLPPRVLGGLEFTVDAVGWKLADVAHLIAFMVLAMVLWMSRPDLRGGKAIAVLLVLAIAAELMQGLTIERSPRGGDVAINLLGAGLGLVFAVVASAWWTTLRQRRSVDA